MRCTLQNIYLVVGWQARLHLPAVPRHPLQTAALRVWPQVNQGTVSAELW